MKQTIQITEEVTKGFNNKNEAAFRELYHIAFNKMRAFSAKVINDWGESEDVTMLAFVKLWNAKTQYTSSEHLRRTLIMIVKNESINYLRSAAKKAKDYKEIDDLDELPDEDRSQAELKEHRLNKIYEYLQLLPEKCRVAMEMRLGGLDARQISNRLGVSIDTITSHHHNAINRFKEYFNTAKM